jgi:NTE family protein
MTKKLHLRMAGSGLNLTIYAGALQAFEEAGYEPATIAGTSGGGVIGAAWASGMTAKEIQDLLLSFMPPAATILDASWFPASWLWNWGLYKMKKLQAEMGKQLKAKGVTHFKDFKTPFACFTANMQTGDLHTWASHKTPDEVVGDRVVDGTRLPIAMQPGWINGMPHRDGGLLYNFPVDFLFPEQDQSIPTIGLLFRGTAQRGGAKIKNALEDGFACIDLMLAATAREHIEDALWAKTIVLEPKSSGMNFLKTPEEAKEDFNNGYTAVKAWLEKNELPAS